MESRSVLMEALPRDIGFVLDEKALLTKTLQWLVETAVKFSKSSQTQRVEFRSGPFHSR